MDIDSEGANAPVQEEDLPPSSSSPLPAIPLLSSSVTSCSSPSSIPSAIPPHIDPTQPPDGPRSTALKAAFQKALHKALQPTAWTEFERTYFPLISLTHPQALLEEQEQFVNRLKSASEAEFNRICTELKLFDHLNALDRAVRSSLRIPSSSSIEQVSASASSSSSSQPEIQPNKELETIYTMDVASINPSESIRSSTIEEKRKERELLQSMLSESMQTRDEAIMQLQSAISERIALAQLPTKATDLLEAAVNSIIAAGPVPEFNPESVKLSHFHQNNKNNNSSSSNGLIIPPSVQSEQE